MSLLMGMVFQWAVFSGFSLSVLWVCSIVFPVVV